MILWSRYVMNEMSLTTWSWRAVKKGSNSMSGWRIEP
jgi:hypothetical protein